MGNAADFIPAFRYGHRIFPENIETFQGSVVDDGGSTPRSVKHLWVHGNVGLDTNDGLSPEAPLLTMGAAFNLLGSGDVIHLNGNIAEDLTTPAGVFDVTVIGEGNRPRHPDAHTTNNGYSGAKITSATSTVAAVIVQQQGWRFVNILFDAPASAAAVELLRNTASGDSERDASHAEFINCRFAGGETGLEITGGQNLFNLYVYGCTFQDLTVGITGTALYRGQIENNRFIDNGTHIDTNATESCIIRNIFGLATTLGVDLTGGTNNVVSGNYFHGDFNVLNVAGTTDMWAGNFAEETGGVTDADPTGS